MKVDSYIYSYVCLFSKVNIKTIGEKLYLFTKKSYMKLFIIILTNCLQPKVALIYLFYSYLYIHIAMKNKLIFLSVC